MIAFACLDRKTHYCQLNGGANSKNKISLLAHGGDSSAMGTKRHAAAGFGADLAPRPATGAACPAKVQFCDSC
jgi:hypothetical protein